MGGFYLTGGAALAGFHLGHRETHDLDLFTLSASLDDATRALKTVGSEIGAALSETQTAPDFRRFIVAREGESVIVDLVFDCHMSAAPDGYAGCFETLRDGGTKSVTGTARMPRTIGKAFGARQTTAAVATRGAPIRSRA
jgi:hypothetical protein